MAKNDFFFFFKKKFPYWQENENFGAKNQYYNKWTTCINFGRKWSNYLLKILVQKICFRSTSISRMWEILGQICGSFIWLLSPNEGLFLMKSFSREAGNLSPAISSSLGHSSIVNFRREVRWRSPLQSIVSRLGKLNSSKESREVGSQPSLGKDFTLSHACLIFRSVRW